MPEKYWDGENTLKVYKDKYEISYYLNNVFHRNDGPAVIWYHENGNIKHKFYFINVIQFDPNMLSFDLPLDTEEKKFMFKLKYGRKKFSRTIIHNSQ